MVHYQLTTTICFNREVQKNAEASKALYNRWCELADQPGHGSKEEYDWTTNELRNRLRSIEWDLEDLEETIGMMFYSIHGSSMSFHWVIGFVIYLLARKMTRIYRFQ